MKDLGDAKKILGMEITRDRGSGRLWLSPENYVLKVLEKFNMVEVRAVTTLLADHFKLSSKECPQSLKEEEEMSQVSYFSAMRSLLYAMVYTSSDLAYAVSTVSRFLSNPREKI